MSLVQFFKLSEYACLVITGSNREKFLQGQLTCDVLAAKPSILGGHCDQKGRVLFNFRLLRCENEDLLILPKQILKLAQKRLQQYAMFSRVNVNVGEYFCYGVIGESDLTATWPQELHACSLNNQAWTIRVDHLPRWLVISKTALNFENPFGENLNWHLAELNFGWVHIKPETSNLFLPQELNFEKFAALSFKKGCYTGQEIIARLHYLGKLKQHLYAADVDGTCEIAQEIFADDKSIGQVADSITLQNQKTLLLAVLKDAALDKTLKAKNCFVLESCRLI